MTDIETSPAPATRDATVHAHAVSLRNGLVAVTLVLAAAVIVAGHDLLAGIIAPIRWTVVIVLMTSLGLLVTACIRSIESVHTGKGPDGLVYAIATSSIALLAIGVSLAWLAPAGIDAGGRMSVHIDGGVICGEVSAGDGGFVKVVREERMADEEGRMGIHKQQVLIPIDTVRYMEEVEACPRLNTDFPANKGQ